MVRNEYSSYVFKNNLLLCIIYYYKLNINGYMGENNFSNGLPGHAKGTL